jgi:hypothetical protein
VSYESEERYWTDYLRVALPVIGLLLMLALFWWWAQQFIGDDGDANDVAESTRTTEIATRPPPTATVTVEAVIQPTESTEETPTPESDGDGAASNDGTPSDEEPNQDCGFTAGQQVVVTEDGVRLRKEPSLADDVEIINTLDAGTPLSIIGDCYDEDEDGNRFWRVRNQETSRTGYISADYIQADAGD